MAITTRTIAKGVPPRLREPKPKGKPRTQNNMTVKGKKPGRRKRSNESSDSEDDDVSISDDSAVRAQKKKEWETTSH